MADDVWIRDQEVDLLHTSLFRELLTYMMEDPRHITACTHLLFIAKQHRTHRRPRYQYCRIHSVDGGRRGERRSPPQGRPEQPDRRVA